MGIRISATSASPQSIRQAAKSFFRRGTSSNCRRTEESRFIQCPDSGVNICVPQMPEGPEPRIAGYDSETAAEQSAN